MPDAPAATTVIDRSGEQELRNKVAQLEADNLKYRKQLRPYKELGTAEEIKQKLPAAGSVVITADRAKALESYEKLGKPEDLEKSVKERDDLKQEVTAQKHQTAVAAAAEAAGLNAKVLGKLPGIDAMKVEVKKEKVDGKDVDVAYITDTAKQGATPQKLTEWVEANHSDFMPALKADVADAERRSTERRYVQQRGTGDTAKPDLTEKIEQRQRAEIGAF